MIDLTFETVTSHLLRTLIIAMLHYIENFCGFSKLYSKAYIYVKRLYWQSKIPNLYVCVLVLIFENIIWNKTIPKIKYSVDILGFMPSCLYQMKWCVHKNIFWKSIHLPVRDYPLGLKYIKHLWNSLEKSGHYM